MSRGLAALLLGLAGALGGLASCAAPRAPDPSAGAPLASARRGTEIAAGGRLFDIGTPVVLWFDAGGFNAYDTQAARAPRGASKPPVAGLRYRPGRTLAQAQELGEPPRGARELAEDPQLAELRALQARIAQFVLHFDVCGASRRCFEVLQQERQLSVHFLLDADGTIYQTLDLADTAWHARQANPRSVGVEIAQIGCYRPGASATLEQWYASDARGPFVKLPASLGDPGWKPPGFVARPERPERVRGAIHGLEYEQYDFTAEQNAALAKLAAGLARALPRLRLDYPRGADGQLLRRALSEAELGAYCGLLGHWHVTEQKVDPGPALDWQRLIERAQAAAAVPQIQH